jgi:molybdate transport system regulatory protein
MPGTSRSSTQPQLKLRIRIQCDDDDAFGPGKAQLIESLLETVSLNRTASEMKMSYVKALALVRAMNAHFSEPLVLLTRGGKQGGGTQVTDAGKKVLAEYHAMQAAGEAVLKPNWKRFQRWLKA